MLNRLIEGIIKKDEKTMAYILKNYGNQMLHFCMLQGLNKEDAKDVIQDVLSELHLKILQFDQRRVKTFGNWIITIAVNKAKDFMKKRNRILLKSDEEIELEACSKIINDTYKNKFVGRSAVLAYIVLTSNLTIEYLAEMFDVSISSIKRYRTRIKKDIRQKMRKGKIG